MLENPRVGIREITEQINFLGANVRLIPKERNELSHSCIIVTDSLAKLATRFQPSYQKHLAPCDFFLFEKLKNSFREKRHEPLEVINSQSLKAQKVTPTDAYNECKDNCMKLVLVQSGLF